MCDIRWLKLNLLRASNKIISEQPVANGPLLIRIASWIFVHPRAFPQKFYILPRSELWPMLHPYICVILEFYACHGWTVVAYDTVERWNKGTQGYMCYTEQQNRPEDEPLLLTKRSYETGGVHVVMQNSLSSPITVVVSCCGARLSCRFYTSGVWQVRLYNTIIVFQ